LIDFNSKVEEKMKKAVIATGGKQYLVKEGDILEVELLKDTKSIDFEALMIIDGEKVSIGKPIIKDSSVKAEVLEPSIKTDKVTSIRYKAKKRVNKVKGHRQLKTKIKISKIA
jgi:large subunit ribosomal protein L21